LFKISIIPLFYYFHLRRSPIVLKIFFGFKFLKNILVSANMSCFQYHYIKFILVYFLEFYRIILTYFQMYGFS
jgi:hypothetical protein